MGAFDHLNSKTASHTPKHIPKMLRFICGLLLVASAMANEQQYQQYQQAQAMDPMMARQGLGASANLEFGDFGSFGAQGNVNLPSYGQDNSLLTTILIGVGLITLFNTIVTLRSLFSLLMTLKRLLLRLECVAKDKLTLSRVTLCKESMPSPPNTNKPFTQQFFQSQSPQGYFLRQTN